jgi:hypothetical protein
MIFVAAEAWGQTLAPIGSGFDLWPIVIVAIIAAAIVGFVLWHKRNPSAADAVLQKARDDASALTAEVTKAVSTLARTNAQQAVVIASPPVQAAINAPAAAQAAPVAAIVPRPAPSPLPPVPATPVAIPAAPTALATAPVAADADPAAPWGYTVGPNGKVANTGPDLGFGYDPFGTPMASQAVADHWKNLMDWQASQDVPSMTDAQSNAVLATFDAESNPWIKWYHMSAKEQLALINRTTRLSIGRMYNEYNGAYGRNIGVPPGWAESACHRLRGD